MKKELLFFVLSFQMYCFADTSGLQSVKGHKAIQTSHYEMPFYLSLFDYRVDRHGEAFMDPLQRDETYRAKFEPHSTESECLYTNKIGKDTNVVYKAKSKKDKKGSHITEVEISYKKSFDRNKTPKRKKHQGRFGRIGK